MFGGFYPGYYEDDWGQAPWSFPPHDHWSPGPGVARRRSRYSRYPVYTRHSQDYYHAPSWLPPGAVQVYGHGHGHGHPRHHRSAHHHHHFYESEFRSNSANLAQPPPVEYVWSHRPTRRTKSSAHPRQHRHHHHHHPVHSRHPPSPQFLPPEPPTLVHHSSSFARRFFNDRETKTDHQHVSQHVTPQVHVSRHHQHNVLIEPDVHDHSQQQSLESELLVRPSSSNTSHQRTNSDRSRNSSRHSRNSSKHSRHSSKPSRHSSKQSRNSSKHSRNSSKHSRNSSKHSRQSSGEAGVSSQYRVISDLIPHTTLDILQTSLSGVHSGPRSGHHPSCTCYQCQSSDHHSSTSDLNTRHQQPPLLTSLTSDINSNLVTSITGESHCTLVLQH